MRPAKPRHRALRGFALLLGVTAAACDEPADPGGSEIEVAYLLERVNGSAPPAPICEEGSADQLLLFESIALADDQTYGRLQQTRIDNGPVIQQEEHGDFIRTDSTILLVTPVDDTLTLALLDDEGERVRRIHTCGDTLRYLSVPVE